MNARCPHCHKRRARNSSLICAECQRANYSFLRWLRGALRLEPIPGVVVRIRHCLPRPPLWKRALESRRLSA